MRKISIALMVLFGASGAAYAEEQSGATGAVPTQDAPAATIAAPAKKHPAAAGAAATEQKAGAAAAAHAEARPHADPGYRNQARGCGARACADECDGRRRLGLLQLSGDSERPDLGHCLQGLVACPFPAASEGHRRDQGSAAARRVLLRQPKRRVPLMGAAMILRPVSPSVALTLLLLATSALAQSAAPASPPATQRHPSSEAGCDRASSAEACRDGVACSREGGAPLRKQVSRRALR